MSRTGKRGIRNLRAKKIEKKEDYDMSFLSHLEELRWHLIRGIIAIIMASVVVAFFSNWVIEDVLLGPAKPDFIVYKMLGIEVKELALQSRKLPGQFFTYWGTILFLGMVLGMPVLIHQLWSFVAPGLYLRKPSRLYWHVILFTFFFLIGIAFGYFILAPFAIQFFSEFNISEQVRNDFDINEYLSSMVIWIFSCGVIFELPMVSLILTKLGILNPKMIRKWRRHALVVCFILAALLTPPDPISQGILAIPLFLLFELSVWICSVVYRGKNGKNIKKV